MITQLRFALFLIIPFVSHLSFARTHVLKKGETLAGVARQYYGEPVFGPKGTIKKIYKLNPWASKSPNSIDPGKEIIIEDSEKTEKPSVAAAAHAPAAPPPVPVPPEGTPRQSPPTPPEDKKAWDQKKVEDMKAAEEKKPEVCLAPAEVRCPSCPVCEKPEVTHDHFEGSRVNEFSVVPFYSMSKISVTTPATGASYDLSTTTSYGARIGWDHAFNRSFSALLEGSTQVWNSGATNGTSGSTFADQINLYSAELAFLNKIGDHSRFGLGFTYGNHIFIENFDSSPANQTAAIFYTLDPVVIAELALYASSALEVPLTLKWSPIGGDLEKGPGLKSGNEFTARLTFVHKLMNSQFTWGFNYFTSDQAEKDKTQKRTDTNFEIGMVF